VIAGYKTSMGFPSAVDPRPMNRLDSLLELLSDGEWHRIADLSARLRLPEPRLKTILLFLSEHGFVQYRESEGSVKIQSELKALMEM